MSTIQLCIGEASLDLDLLIAKDSGNQYFGLANENGNFTGFGEPVPALASVLPDEVRLVQDGKTLATVTLTHGLTAAQDKKGRPLTPRPRAYTASPVPVTCSLGEKVAEVSMSITKSGDWNIVASVRGAGGGSGAARKVTKGWGTVTVIKAA